MPSVKEKLKVHKTRKGVAKKFVPRPPEDPAVIEARWKKKKDQIHQLASDVSRLRLNVSKDLKSDNERTALIALIIAVMDRIGERIGNCSSIEEGHYGVTYFKKSHVKVTGKEVEFNYIGKAGVPHNPIFTSEKISMALKQAIKNSPSKFLFETSDKLKISNEMVNSYLREFGITGKVLRGYHINKKIVEKLSSVEVPENEKDRKKLFNKIVKKTAADIGHGAGTCKKHYIVPELPEQYIMHGKIIDLKSQKYYKEGGEIEKKKASDLSNDASLSARYPEKLSSDATQLGTKDNLISSESNDKDNTKTDIGGNYSFKNNFGSFTSVKVMPVDEDFKLSKDYFTVEITVRYKNDEGQIGIQKPKYKTFPISMYEKYMEDLKDRGADVQMKAGGKTQIKKSDVTKSEAFKKWFDDSKIVDNNGNPLVLYHGSKEKIEVFDKSKSNDTGFHFGTERQAKMRNSAVIIPVFLKATNIKNVKDSGGGWIKKINRAKAEGFDAIKYLNRFEGIPRIEYEEAKSRGIKIDIDSLDRMTDSEFKKNIPSAEYSYIVFDSNQIKIADGSNTTFDLNNFDIRFAEGGSTDAEYKKWKRKNVTLRGMKEVGEENNAGAMLGRGLYTAALSNRSLSREYGTVYFAVNARPKNPKKFNTLNDWEIWFYNNLVYNYSKAKGKEFPDKRDFNASTTIEDEMQKLGYDGIEIVGREIVNFKPGDDVRYYKTEDQLKDYYDRMVKMENGGITENDDNPPKNEDFASSDKKRIFVPTNVSKNEISKIIAGTRPITTGDAIQAASSYLRRSESTSTSGRSSHFFRGQDEERLREYISQNNLWIPLPDSKDEFASGGEAKVYLYGEYVIKINDAAFYGSWEDYLNSLLLHNYFFPGTAYELIGFSEYKDFDERILYAVVKQSFIQETSATDLNKVTKFMFDIGFINTKGFDYYSSDLGITLRDLHQGNVLTKYNVSTKEDVLYFIDTVFYIDFKILEQYKGGGYIRQSYVDEIIREINEAKAKGRPAVWANNYFTFTHRADGEMFRWDINADTYKTYTDINEFARAVRRFQNRGWKEGGEISKNLFEEHSNLKTVNKFISERYPKLYAVQGNGYLYWHSDNDKLQNELAKLYSSSVDQGSFSKPNHISIGTWLEYADNIMKEIEDNKKYFKADGGSVSDLKPAHLMTLQEYEKNVTPLIKEFQKFVRKNAQYLSKSGYYGLQYHTWKDVLNKIPEKFTGEKKGYEWYKDISEIKRREFIEEDITRAKYEWEKSTGKEPNENTPKDVLDTYKSYQDKFKVIFGDDISRIESDEAKSNKRAVRRAIDHDVYKKMLEGETIKIEELEKIAESVGVKIPKKVFDENFIKAQERKNLYEQIYASMPSANKEILSKMVDDVIKSFKPVEEEIYEKEMKRYKTLIEKIVKENFIKDEDLYNWLEIYDKIFYPLEKEKRIEEIEISDLQGKRKKKIEVTYLKNFKLKPTWEEYLATYVRNYVESLRVNLLSRIIDNFRKITLPIKEYRLIELGTGAKGFQGEFYFGFVNGSHFVFKTQAIGAGGYNIQRYHYRYLSDFTDIILADGSKGKAYNIVVDFSDKAADAKANNPLVIVANAKSTEELIDLFYNYLKAGNISSIQNVRKYPMSIGYKEQPYLRPRAIYFTKPPSGKELMDLPEAKEKVLKFLQEYKAKNPNAKLEEGGKLQTHTPTLNSDGGYEYYGKDEKTAEHVGLITLSKKIPGTNCENCIFFKGGFCDHEKVLLPVTNRMCCSYWNETSLSTIISEFPNADFFPDKKLKEKKYPKNSNGGYNYDGEGLQRAKNADLITLPKEILGTTCKFGNCKWTDKNNFCTHPKVQLPVTDRMTCSLWDNNKVVREWGKPKETFFEQGGQIPLGVNIIKQREGETQNQRCSTNLNMYSNQELEELLDKAVIWQLLPDVAKIQAEMRKMGELNNGGSISKKLVNKYYKINYKSLDQFKQFLKELKPLVETADVFFGGIGEAYLKIRGHYNTSIYSFSEEEDIANRDFHDLITETFRFSYKSLRAVPQPENRWNGKWRNIDETLAHLGDKENGGPVSEKSSSTLHNIVPPHSKSVETKERGEEIDNPKGTLKFKKLFNNLFIINCDTQQKLAKTFVRLNSYLDSEEFKNKIFTLSEFRDWYIEKKGAFTYYTDYAGFNIPSPVIDVFLSGKFDPLSEEEKWLMDNLKSNISVKPYYIIGYVDIPSEEHTRKHELSHALYYLNPTYKKEANNIIEKFRKEISYKAWNNLKKFLVRLQYDESIWNDEITAYLISGKNYLISENAWSDEFDKYSKILNVIFEKNYLEYFGHSVKELGKIGNGYEAGGKIYGRPQCQHEAKSMDRGGLVVGARHDDGPNWGQNGGGVPFVISDTNEHIEEEGLEVNIPREVTDDTKEYTFTGKNHEILDQILKLKGGKGLSAKVTHVKSGDIVICIKSVWDDAIRTYKGTLIQILSAINTSNGCKLIEPGAKVLEGGEAGKMDRGGIIREREMLEKMNPILRREYLSRKK